jgi:HK97 gp10 family phage protein
MIRIEVIKLPRFDIDGIEDVLLDEMERFALEVEKEAKQLCPVDTGTLRGSITGKAYEDSDKLIAEIAPDNGEGVGNCVEYAIFQECGTRHHSAQPFLNPAFDHQLQGLEERIAEIIVENL